MDIRQLQYLVVLSEEKHFTRAAAVCNVTQPTLSGRIRQLEIELGVPIVERGKKFHGLTQEGERIVTWAKKILSDCNSLRSEANGQGVRVPSRVSMAVIPSAATQVSHLVHELKARWPAAHIAIQPLSHDEIQNALNDFAVDCAITYLAELDQVTYNCDHLYNEDYRLFVASDHRLACQETVSLHQVTSYPMIALSARLKNRQFVDAAFRQAACWREPDIECGSLEMMLSLLPGSKYAAIMPEHFSSFAGPDVVTIPLSDQGLSHEVGFISLRRDMEPVLVQGLHDIMAKYARKHYEMA
ncbi:LysR family transcriptional regulator [Polycladidibacter stylochi]|uniref:LysR family transcriptional regulator n=1 Tax=Polycladidibacter stylochi TaxID=1807766 RepID=UPI000A4046D4|nr:LysR family transcriptional regulator [Pseudovibrio stylochi]